jgi:hypothetical protein
MKCLFCSSELIEPFNEDLEGYYCKNCLCSYWCNDSIYAIYFDFGSDLELNVPLDDDMDAYPIGIEFDIKNNVVNYNNWKLNIHQSIKDMKISSAEEAKDLVKRMHNLKLFI